MTLGSAELVILLVEDDPIILLDTSMTLHRLGAGRVDAALTLAEAEAFVNRQRPTVAVMDIELRDGTSFLLADRLQREGTACVFTTGHGAELPIPPDLKDLPIIAKPYDPEQLLLVLKPYLDREAS
ncbi:response regulator [Geminicoccus flavidas]|uniref:response regulator n=1 Tax=Geminicoccus flavidas TaxID=2506407 RepID=UPI00135BCC97|nr:response regulator [Geminicoccus flavidas]